MSKQAKLTETEKETVKRLIKLGDNEKLAIETVVSMRKSAETEQRKQDIYFNAYHI